MATTLSVESVITTTTTTTTETIPNFVLLSHTTTSAPPYILRPSSTIPTEVDGTSSSLNAINNTITTATGNILLTNLVKQLDASTIISNLTENNSTDLIVKKLLDEPILSNQRTILKIIHDYLLVILLISVMFSMGCGVTLRAVWNHLRRPQAVLVCLLAQFILVPFIGFLMMLLLELDPLHATGLLILAACPGGVTSNIFTYLADGDLPLSITMTSVATIAALILMPLNVWLYGRNLETNNLIIPYMEMALTLILVTIPVIMGMFANWQLPKLTPYITKIGMFAGFGIIIICQTLEVLIFPDIFADVPYRLYTAVILLPAFSFLAGYGFSRMFHLNEQISRTIAIEIGIKNVGSALTIVTLSFAMKQLKKAWVFPFLYAFSSFLVIFIMTIGFKMYTRLKAKMDMDMDDLSESDEEVKDKIPDDESYVIIVNSDDPMIKEVENHHDENMNTLKESLLLPTNRKLIINRINNYEVEEIKQNDQHDDEDEDEEPEEF